MKRICVYAASNPGTHPEYADAAVRLGQAIARRGCDLIYGGSKLGLMGKVADEAMRCGGKVIGIMPRGLFRAEIEHTGLTEFHEVESMHERKAKMAELSDAFVALPGGLGTFDELFEAACWSQIGIHSKPIGLLNVRGFYEPLLQMLQHTAREGFMKEASLHLFVVESDPDKLLDRLAAYRPIDAGNKWMELPSS
ncbi:TIGR00730 family Rossman fold protein [Paenibacillus hamazuiensis]|uniref:LOG family protein n=1 Tax=Paenibacillus hamazuiensis TaxID=2936508 RepID=UPI00200FF09F|nr:TIGR00730 family Rossman fold protein [Paenibacillus hamazuiensis]